MSSSFEKSVKGGTKVKLAPPKSKYVEHILIATQSGEAGVAEVFRTLTHRLRDSTWTVAFKSLIIVHLMIKEGVKDVTLAYLSHAPANRLAINTFTDVQTQGQNIRRYSEYLLARAKAFASSRCDYVRSGDGRMKKLTVDKGLLRETEVVQEQLRALVKCTLLDNDVENEISLTAFRLLTRDLLDLYNVENEAVMNVLSHYFEMSKPDAERAIRIYKTFCKQTDSVVQYLGVARQYEHATRLEIPKIKHAPTSLAASLQEYLDDKDFDVNRRQYLAEQEAKRTGKPAPKPSAQPKAEPASRSQAANGANGASGVAANNPFTQAQPAASSSQVPAAKGPAPDLIDFFESIEQNQQPMSQNASQFQQQPTGFQPQQQTGFQQQPQPAFSQPMSNGYIDPSQGTNPFGQPQIQQQQQQQQQPPQAQPLQTNFTGAGFGGFGPQPTGQQTFAGGNAFGQQPQQQQAFSPVQTQSPQIQSPQQIQLQQTGTNPFRQSVMPTGAQGAFSQAQQQPLQRQGTNPFARSAPPDAQQQAPGSQGPMGGQAQPTFQPIQSQPTGTNPFARNITPSQQPTPPMSPPNALQVQQTGSTNPFRQSAFVNQQTGGGWQQAQQPTMGGLENLETIPVFPRPGDGGQQQQQSPWG